jgi:hypothetical protein
MSERPPYSPFGRLLALGVLFATVSCARPTGQGTVDGNGLSEAGSRLAGPPSSKAEAPPAPPAPAPVLISGFTQTEAQGITEAVRGDLLARQFSWQGPGWGVQHPCTEVFDVGQPLILDATLSGQTGRVRVGTAITAQHPYRAPPHFNIQWFYPTRNCYGVEDDGRWVVGRTVQVQIDYNVEHWQSGWRLAANQGPS